MLKKALFILIPFIAIAVILVSCGNKTDVEKTSSPTSLKNTVIPGSTITPSRTLTPSYTSSPGMTDTGALNSPTVKPTSTPTSTPTPKPADYVIFSHKAGYYQSSFNLALTTKDGYTIYYTNDYSNPTTGAKKYTGVISINDRSSSDSANDRATVIKAAAFSGNIMVGPIYTCTYIVNSDYSTFDRRFGNLPVVSISTDNKNLNDSAIGIFRNPTGRGREWERPCHIEFFDKGGILGFSQDAGIRVYGGTSRGAPLKSLKLFARKEYDPENGKFKYPLFPGRINTNGELIDRYDTFLLRAGGNDNIFGADRTTYLRDGIIHNMAGKIPLIDFQEFRPAVVYINGKYWGIMNIRDAYDNDYIEEHYDIDREKLAMISYGHEDGKWGFEIDEGTAADQEDYIDMINFIASFDMTVASNYQRASNWLDLDNFIQYMAVNLYTNNRDWPGNNVKMWKYIGTKSSKYGEDGKWRFLLKDIDYSWGRYDAYFPGAASVMAEETGHNRNVIGGGDDLGRILHSLLKNNAFKTKFVNFMCDLSNEYFSSNTVQLTVKSFRDLIANEMKRHLTNSWDGNTPGLSYEQWLNNVDGLIAFGNIRDDVMRNLIRETLGMSNITKVNIKVINLSYGTVKMNTIEVKNADWQGSYYNSTEVPLLINVKSGHKVESVTVSGNSSYRNNVLTLNNPSGEVTVTVRFK